MIGGEEPEDETTRSELEVFEWATAVVDLIELHASQPRDFPGSFQIPRHQHPPILREA